MDQKLRDELKVKYPGTPMEVLKALGVEIVIRPAPEVDWLQFKAFVNSGDGAKVAQANKFLVGACVVYPNKDEVLAMISKRAGLADTFGNECRKLTGAVEDVEVGEL
jgi:hypothetical protein